MLARFVCVLVLCGMLAACATPATPAATGLSATDPVAPDRAIVILGVRQHERAVALEPYISLQFSLAQFGADQWMTYAENPGRRTFGVENIGCSGIGSAASSAIRVGEREACFWVLAVEPGFYVLDWILARPDQYQGRTSVRFEVGFSRMQNGRRVRRGRGEVLGFKAEAGTVAFLGSFDAFAYQSIMQSYQPGEFRDARAEDLALILERRPQLAGREISLGRLQSESQMFLRR